MNEPTKLYLSARDLAEDLGISARRVNNLVETQQLTASGRLRRGTRPYLFDPDVIAPQIAAISRRKRPARAA